MSNPKKKLVSFSRLPKVTKTDYEKAPTPRQKAIWEWMLSFQREHCIPASIREICTHFGITSTNGISCHMTALIKKGYVMHIGDKGNSRAMLAVYKEEGRCPCCGRVAVPGTPYGRRLNTPDPADNRTSAEEYRNLPEDRGWARKT